MTRTPAALALVALLALGGCGGEDDAPASTEPTRAASLGTTSTTPATVTAAPSPTSPGAKEFPAADVPVLGDAEVVEGAQAAEGRRGWVVRSELDKPSDECFDDVVAALVDAGFTLQGDVQVAGNHQAQLTNDEYAVIVAANDLRGTRCAVVYSVGQVRG